MKKIHVIIIIFAILVIAGTFYAFSQDASQTPTEQEQVAQQSEEQLILPPLTEEQLTALWANGERCPNKSFLVPNPTTPELDGTYLDYVRVLFTEDVTCEDIEKVAILLDAKITGEAIGYKISEFQLPTKTLEDLEEAITKIEKLENKKIISARKVRRLDIEEF